MFELPSIMQGYTPAILALIFVAMYFGLVAIVVNSPGPPHVSVARYEPPPGVSPAVAAWLLERDLSRAIAAALINMAAKGYLKIGRRYSFCSITQLESSPAVRLEREENALSYRLFYECDWFDFDRVRPQLIGGIKVLQYALQDTTYFSSNAGLSYPAWVISGAGIFFALANTHIWSQMDRVSIRVMVGAAVATFVSFVVAVSMMRGTIEKIATRFPGSTAPQRPWTGADRKALRYLFASFGGIALIGLISSTGAALIILGFLVLNGFFFHSLQGLTPAGREALAQISDYRKFLSEVDADVISRLHVSEQVPAQLRPQDAYAVALHLDLGWGEQFVSSITEVVELASISKSVKRQDAGLSVT